MKNEKGSRPESYPKPTETDQQLKSQEEFMEPAGNLTDDLLKNKNKEEESKTTSSNDKDKETQE
ncbi:MAG: hypothetical protein ABR502_01270 [Chitinophagaceae bacterium]